jgi:phage tail sheath gpL-like
VKTLVIPGILPGPDNGLTYAERDLLVKSGGSHTENVSGSVVVGDLVTTKTTEGGDPTEDWRFTIIIPNLQFKIYALETTFRGSPFNRAVVLDDGDPPGPTYGVRPSTVKAFTVGLVDDWVSRGISTKRDEIVEGIEAEIDGSNPGRINLLIPDVPSAGLRILAAKIEWAFIV